MTRIDFYFNAPDKLGVAVKLARKAYVAKKRLLVYTSDSAQLDALDRLMWLAPPTGFLPHCRANHRNASETAILLTAESGPDAPMPHHEILMNLDAERPTHFSRFDRVLEIVSRDDADDRAQARARLKFYRDRGYEIGTVDLDKLKDRDDA